MKQLTDLSKLDITNKNIFIIGKPASGKTYLSEKMWTKFSSHICIHTDDYIKNEAELKVKLKCLIKDNVKFILEGNQAFAFFRYNETEFYPDILLELRVTDSHVRNIYEKERDIEKYDMAIAFYNFRKENFDSVVKSDNHNIEMYFYGNKFNED